MPKIGYWGGEVSGRHIFRGRKLLTQSSEGRGFHGMRYGHSNSSAIHSSNAAAIAHPRHDDDSEIEPPERER
jgi:hypothetical protein